MSFLSGLELSRRFYWEAVRPLLDQHFPGVPHAAALLGPGSEVLGFDTTLSMDHDWFPRVQLFLRVQDAGLEARIGQVLADGLPHRFLELPVDAVPYAPEPETRLMALRTSGPVQHGVVALTVRAASRRWLNWEPDRDPEPADWLTFPSQVLRSVTGGAVHHDEVGELTAFRSRLAWYPHDVWLYVLASGWRRIAQEEHLMPRAGHAGDEVGSAIIAARLVRDCMRLCFLIERRYAPYPKWLGTAFGQLSCAGELSPHLWRALQAPTWQAREKALCEAYEHLARLHNGLNITEPLPTPVSGYYSRPFQVIHADRFATALLDQITDPIVRQIANRGLIGSVDQFSDSTDLRSYEAWRPRLRALYEGGSPPNAGE
ncbi:MAG TPA: DUF4037 domain-containing protein [Anaerolineae bacterium]|nr:DUF4037 domain-containing protein [Anaerolineae bacterium]